MLSVDLRTTTATTATTIANDIPIAATKDLQQIHMYEYKYIQSSGL